MKWIFSQHRNTWLKLCSHTDTPISAHMKWWEWNFQIYLNICNTLRTFCLSAGFKTVYINNSPDITTNSKWYPAHEICFFAIWGKCCRMQISMSSEFWAAFGNKSSSLWLFPEKDQCPVSFNFIWRCQENFVKEMDIYQWAEWMGVDRFQVMNLLENKVFNFPKLDPLLPPPSPPSNYHNTCRSNFRASSKALLVWSLNVENPKDSDVDVFGNWRLEESEKLDSWYSAMAEDTLLKIFFEWSKSL